MWLGAATYAAAPFKVSNAGALTASSFALSGGSAINLLTVSKNTNTNTPTDAVVKELILVMQCYLTEI